MYGALAIIIILTLGGVMVLQKDVFGAKPSGKRLEAIKKSKNHKDGKFQNLSYTPPLAEGYNYIGVLYNFLFNKKDNLEPADTIPSIKTELKSLPSNANILIWFGHSSYFIQLEGKTFLIDPVLNGYAAPFKGMNKAFVGTDKYKVEDLPKIDYLIITHDHYDHLDYETVKKLKGNVGEVICALGIGAHFEKWGYDPSRVMEKDWGDTVILDSLITVHFTPARHFSGRSLSRDNTLWTSYVLQTPTRKLFLGGDSGYDKHFAEIGKKFGGFDLAILENGQYNEAWRYIHTMPEEVLQAGKDLNAKRIFPVHSGKFNLGGHAWNEPLKRITELNKKAGHTLVTPMIGEIVDFDNTSQSFKNWWEELK